MGPGVTRATSCTSADEGISADEAVYYSIHVNQGSREKRTTVASGTPGGIPPATDVCANIDGTQTTTPVGMTNTAGICTTTNADGGPGPPGGPEGSDRSS